MLPHPGQRFSTTGWPHRGQIALGCMRAKLPCDCAHGTLKPPRSHYLGDRLRSFRNQPTSAGICSRPILSRPTRKEIYSRSPRGLLPPRNFLGFRHQKHAHKKKEGCSHHQEGEASRSVVESLHGSALKPKRSNSHLALFQFTFLGMFPQAIKACKAIIPTCSVQFRGLCRSQ